MNASTSLGQGNFMRFTPALFAAAAATIAGFVRLALGDDPMHWADPADLPWRKLSAATRTRP